MLVLFGLAVVGLVLMIVAADHLVVGASRIAVRLRVTPIVVGVVIIGLGTSAPEFLVAGLASAQGKAEMALGSLVGSNIVNVTMVLGVSALVAPIAVYSVTLRREAPMSAAAVALFAAAVVVGLGPWIGALLTFTMFVALWVLIRLARGAAEPVTATATPGTPAAPGPATTGPSSTEPAATGPADAGSTNAEPSATEPPATQAADAEPAAPPPAVASEPPPRTGVESLRTLLGLVGTLAGAQLLVTNAEQIATQLGVSPVVIGFTLVAVGTSLPELVTAIQAQRRGQSDLLVGNLLGSNLFNSLAGGAVVAFAMPVGDDVSMPAPLLAVMVGIALLAWVILWRGVKRWEGAVLLVLYLVCLPLLL